tara:strand:- start:205 stop:429 length:225 start_codon:yes stop_codon:yes gene_type:complete
MIPKSMLLGMLRPLLPKLERFLKSHENLKDGERAKIMMDIVDDGLHIQIVAIKQKDDGEFVITQILQDVDPKEL